MEAKQNRDQYSKTEPTRATLAFNEKYTINDNTNLKTETEKKERKTYSNLSNYVSIILDNFLFSIFKNNSDMHKHR